MDCHEGSRPVLHVLDKPQSLVGDQVRKVIAGMGAVGNIAILPPVFPTLVIVPVVLHTAVVVEGVVVVPGVLDQSQPLTPAWRDVGAVILVEVFAHVSSQVSTGLEVGGEGSLLVPLLPLLELKFSLLVNT